ncbi:hemolysin family protein [Parasphaerochaeta coccoides]|uniref:CBS domain containing protein n=1 Tax=Parasphaerochaeta coccoides (strain ATCC BAA-1237 / DSM 17374 / SPN1) TaxID=760011 RepID=F4GIJ0_PARC1|nr:hemolysin family protein [Parasphaerochaeta coccoides]AEC01698.1 CBS domain containing protein [Parasphaerochaeta coccoides DSM 17374]
MFGAIKALFGKEKSEENDGSDQSEEPSSREEQRDMIEGIAELAQKTVKEIMVPRVDVQFVAIDASLDDIYDLLAEQGYSRYPVYSTSPDNVVGVLYIKDVLKRDIAQDFNVGRMMRPPFFVPETKRLDVLLREFRRKRVHMAIAIDEYGGVSGVVCMEDILEVIVGNIQDEYDDEEEEVIALSPGIWSCDGRSSLEDVNDITGLEFPDNEAETIGGYVFELFGRVPLAGETASDGKADFVVENVSGNKIERVRIVVKYGD